MATTDINYSSYLSGGGNGGISIADLYSGKYAFSKSPSGGKSMIIDPLSAGLAGVSAISNIFSGIAQGQQQKRQMQAQFDIAAAQERSARDAQFQNLLAGQYALTGAKAFDQGLQRDAANYQQAFLDPRANQLESEGRQRLMSDMLSPNAQKLRRQQNVDALNRTLVENRARTDAMFGQVRQDPFAYGNVPSYAA